MGLRSVKTIGTDRIKPPWLQNSRWHHIYTYRRRIALPRLGISQPPIHSDNYKLIIIAPFIPVK
ncbi:hypothetical protein Hanom_Chr05g00403281 [Helianthus anomalus]